MNQYFAKAAIKNTYVNMDAELPHNKWDMAYKVLMHILVTGGGGGFFGTHVINSLLTHQPKHEIVG